MKKINCSVYADVSCKCREHKRGNFALYISDKVFILSNTTDVFNFIISYEEEGLGNNLINENGGPEICFYSFHLNQSH